MRYVKVEPHGIGQPTYHDGAHRVDGQRCLAHAHCGSCQGPLVMDKLGRYRHIEPAR